MGFQEGVVLVTDPVELAYHLVVKLGTHKVFYKGVRQRIPSFLLLKEEFECITRHNVHTHILVRRFHRQHTATPFLASEEAPLDIDGFVVVSVEVDARRVVEDPPCGGVERHHRPVAVRGGPDVRGDGGAGGRDHGVGIRGEEHGDGGVVHAVAAGERDDGGGVYDGGAGDEEDGLGA